MTLKDRLAGWAKRLAGAMGALDELHAADQDLRRTHAELKKERNKIVSAPGPREEVLANFDKLIEAEAARWQQEAGASLIRHGSPGFTLQRDGELVPQRPAWPGEFQKVLTLKDVAGLFPDLVKTQVAALVTTTTYTPGPAASDRWAALKTIDQKIAEIEEQHAALVDAAAALTPPVALTLLPDVAARRETERDLREREATAAERRREQEARVNQQYPTRRDGRSRYLTEQAK
ncbi:MAG: hypothetical protein WC713_11795 [Candidatus Methylomirabilota bacterium]